MLIRCPHCLELIEYNPQRRTVLGRKRCTACGRWFSVKEQDIVSEERSTIRTDRDQQLIRNICVWMESGHQITTWSEIKAEFNLSGAGCSRLLKRMVDYGLIKKVNAFLGDKRYGLHNLSALELLDTQDNLPEYFDWHFIKIGCQILSKPTDADLWLTLEQRGFRLGVDYKVVLMRGSWYKTFIKSDLPRWEWIEVNSRSVYLNYRGVIRSRNPQASVEDIEAHDLMQAMIFLDSLGITIGNRIEDVQGHWALLGQKLTRREIGMYANLWSDYSTGAPELETESYECAIDMMDVLKSLRNTEEFLKFKFYHKDRHDFFKLKDLFKKKRISFMQFSESAQQIETFQMFRFAANYREQLELQTQVITR